jgi:phosphoribosylamine--glycine ligase
MNVLPLLKSDFIELSKAMIDETLHKEQVRVDPMATVCKYVVPEGYGIKSMENQQILVDENQIIRSGSQLFYASVNKTDDIIMTTSSRSLAVVGREKTIAEAETRCERALEHVRGDHIYIRHDVGTQSLIEKQVNNMKKLRGI